MGMLAMGQVGLGDFPVETQHACGGTGQFRCFRMESQQQYIVVLDAVFIPGLNFGGPESFHNLSIVFWRNPAIDTGPEVVFFIGQANLRLAAAIDAAVVLVVFAGEE